MNENTLDDLPSPGIKAPRILKVGMRGALGTSQKWVAYFNSSAPLQASVVWISGSRPVSDL